ncbi:helix-turn-helix domain-containing protein [Ferrovibrio sp.]|uniref:helix-turn-helix domain-containing protein n=1 Tax=Ferrovibrio sp. TaxID=1917215 RepID=UPI0035B3B543
MARSTAIQIAGGTSTRETSAWDATDFASWFERLGVTRGEAADLIGIGRSALYRYLTGEQPVPRTVELACRWVAVERGIKLPKAM